MAAFRMIMKRVFKPFRPYVYFEMWLLGRIVYGTKYFALFRIKDKREFSDFIQPLSKLKNRFQVIKWDFKRSSAPAG